MCETERPLIPPSPPHIYSLCFKLQARPLACACHKRISFGTYLWSLTLLEHDAGSIAECDCIGVRGGVPKVPRPFRVLRERKVAILVPVAMGKHVKVPTRVFPNPRIFNKRLLILRVCGPEREVKPRTAAC